jgi:hypothetical protein
MSEDRAIDRRNRKWGSLQDAAQLKVQISRRTKAILSALRHCEEEKISYGAVIEKLAEQHANLLHKSKSHSQNGPADDESYDS